MSQGGGSSPLPALLLDRSAYQARLALILPPAITSTTATCNPGAAAAAFTMMYVGAIDQQNPVRPVTLTRMNDEIGSHRTDDERRAYYTASMAYRANRRIDALCAAWGVSREGWYQAHSREGVRDETFHAWEKDGALIWDHSVKTTSGAGRYTLTGSFAALLDPTLDGDDFAGRVRAWQTENLGPIGRARAAAQAARAKAGSSVAIQLPGDRTRYLDAGSETLAAFVQYGAPALMKDPVLVFVSQSGDPVNIVDSHLLTQLGLDITAAGVLPDCLMVDIERGELWFIEVDDSDGPVHEERKALLIRWATESGVAAEACRFLTAFKGRTDRAAKRDLPRLARDTYGWYADEPDMLLAWDVISRFARP